MGRRKSRECRVRTQRTTAQEKGKQRVGAPTKVAKHERCGKSVIEAKGASMTHDDAGGASQEQVTREKTAELQTKIEGLMASDPEFGAKLSSDPKAAFEEAGLTALAQEVEQLRAASMAESEVAGHVHTARGTCGQSTYTYCCC
jgi:hypothetical protein